jgi:hypothetical protein
MKDGGVSQKGSGVVFGQRVFHVENRCPKSTPDPDVGQAPNSIIALTTPS